LTGIKFQFGHTLLENNQMFDNFIKKNPTIKSTS